MLRVGVYVFLKAFNCGFFGIAFVMFSAKQRQNLCKNTGIRLKHSVVSEFWEKKTSKAEKNFKLH